MAKSLQLRYGTTAQNEAFVGSNNEISYDTERRELHMHDGTNAGGNVVFPCGGIIPYAGVLPPKGWLFCDGRSVLKTSYATLYSVIGDTYDKHYYYAWKDGSNNIYYTTRPGATLCKGDPVYTYNTNNGYEQVDTVNSGYEIVGPGNIVRSEATADNPGGMVAGFTTNTNYIKYSNAISPTTSFEFVTSFFTPASYNNANDITARNINYESIIIRILTSGALNVWMTSNTTSWDIASQYAPGLTFTAGALYWLKITWDGSVYRFYSSTNGTDYTEAPNSITNSTPLKNKDNIIYIGGGPAEQYAFWGSIDLSQTSIKVDDTIITPHTAMNFTTAGDVTRSSADDNITFDLPINRHIVESQRPTAENGYSWYNLYSDGWVEQGGYSSNEGRTTVRTATIVLPIEMQNDKYQITRTVNKGGISNSPETRWAIGINANDRTTKMFTMFTDTVTYVVGNFWKVEGYANTSLVATKGKSIIKY